MKPLKGHQWTDMKWAAKAERKVVEAGLETGHMGRYTHSQDGTNQRKKEAVTPGPVVLRGLPVTRERKTKPQD